MDLKEEARGAGKRVIAVGIATAAMGLVRWIVSRPIKRAIERKRARVAREEAERGDHDD